MISINITRKQYVELRKRFGITCRGPKPGMVHIHNLHSDYGQIQFTNYGSNGINKTNHSISWQEDKRSTSIAISWILEIMTDDLLAKVRKS